MQNIAEEWLGGQFNELHPLLQDLHRNPSTLTGQVEVSFGRGVAGVLGKRIASRLGVPIISGEHTLEVSIYGDGGVLHWVRSFDGQSRFHSEFKPVGRYPSGHWVERSGVLTLLLDVRVVSGGWHWVHRSTKLFGIALPRAFLPAAVASKSIDRGLYRFSVEVGVPALGKLFGYSGTLAANPSAEGALPAVRTHAGVSKHAG